VILPEAEPDIDAIRGFFAPLQSGRRFLSEHEPLELCRIALFIDCVEERGQDIVGVDAIRH